MIGGLVMGLAIVLYFVVLLRSLAAAQDPILERTPFSIPICETYHDENVPAVRNFMPWVTAAVLLVVLAYYPPLSDIVKSKFKTAPGYRPDSPVAVQSVR
jgi:CDP-diglyceride synthetase